MSGWRGVPPKQRRAFRRRNHVARDLYTPVYGPRIKEPKRNHLRDELEEKEMAEEAYDFVKSLGLTTKE